MPAAKSGKPARTNVIVACLATLLAAGAAHPAFADELHSFHITAADASAAVREFAHQSGVQIMASADALKEKTLNPIVGEHTTEDALNMFLADTGLRHEYIGDRGVVIAPAMPSKGKGQQPPGKDAAEEIVVTGSRLRHSAAAESQQVNIYSQEDIQKSGQGTLLDFLNTLPEVSTSLGQASFQSFYVGQSTVQLRGLPVGTTLVLINGRRLQQGAQNGKFFDLNLLPAAAVERIEVLPQGSSAIYGSDALAGVVNIILRRDHAGLQADAQYGVSDGIDESTFSAAWGRQWSQGSLSLMATYHDRGDLRGGERGITADTNYTRFGGPDRRSLNCSPGNVSSVDGSNLPGLTAPNAAIPAGITGNATIADFVDSDGAVRRCDLNAQQTVIAPTKRYGLLSYADWSVAQATTLFTELMYSRVEQTINGLNGNGSYLVPATNPFNPFGVPVRVNYQFANPQIDTYSEFTTYFTRYLLGIRSRLSDSWDWELAAWRAQDRDYNLNRLSPFRDPRPALNSTDPATALNLFTSAPPASLDVLMNAVYRDDWAEYRGETLAANGFLRGRLFGSSALPLDVVVGAEHYRDLRKTFFPTDAFASVNLRRSTSSVFAEVRLPLLRDRERAGSADILALSGALRHDDHSDVDASTVPQVAAEWRPIDGLLLRAAYAEGFRAPELAAISGRTISVPSTVFDARNGGVQTSVTAIFGASPDLAPETGESRSLGVAWSPQRLPGLQTSLNYFEIQQVDRVALLFPQMIVDSEALFPGRVVRAPDSGATPGPIQSVNFSFVNFGLLEVEGLDLDLRYSLSSPWGKFSPSVRATEILHYQAAITPNAPLTDRLARASTDAYAPRWKGTAALGWELGALSASLTARYVGEYQDYAALPSGATRELGNFWLYDLSARYAFGGENNLRGMFSDAAFQVGAVNLLDSLPEFSMFSSGGVGYDPSQYDIRGRFVYAQLHFDF